jgi:trk system potassium uptake protein TrkH
VLLLLPFAHAPNTSTDLLTAFFTATSAVCVTGLTVVSTHDHWSPVGQAIILALVQLGAIGFVIGAVAILTFAGRRASSRERMLFGQNLGVGEPGGLRGLVWRIVAITLVIETIGAVFLYFRVNNDPGVENSVWWATFHAVSGFTNAGFDIETGSKSFARLVDDPGTLGIVSLLSIIGALGFTVLLDMVRHRRWRRLGFESRIVLATLPAVTVIGFALLFLLAPTFGNAIESENLGLRATTAVNLTVWRTAGFSAVDMGQLLPDTLIIVIVLMFIGGASASVTGGITVNTLGILFITMQSHIRGHRYPAAFIMRAIAIVGLSACAVLLATVIMSIAERGSSAMLSNLLFEAVSAFAVVGYSTGITADLSAVSKVVLIVTMFVGRLGALTLAQALIAREHQSVVRYPEEVIKVG